MTDEETPAPAIVDPSGRPARAAVGPLACPGCGTACPRGDVTKRRLSGGFGVVHDLCATCGHDFGELTIPLVGKT